MSTIKLNILFLEWRHQNKLYKLCCVTRNNVNENPRTKKNEQEAILETVASLKEEPKMAMTTQVMAVVVMSAASFIWGYFA